MAIQSGSATFTRFFVPEPETGDFWSFVDEQLKAGAFQDLEEGEEKSKGFASWDDLFDSTFEFASYHKGEYVAFQFRQDQRKIPTLVIKQHLRAAIKKYGDEHQGRRPSRQEYMALREATEQALLRQALAQPSACEVVWNPQQKWMLCGTTSARTLDLLLEHFERFFKIYPIPLYHVHWAVRSLPLNDAQRDRLEALVPVQSSQALHDGRFLGYEFLTWLWYFIEEQQGILTLAENQGAELALGEKIVLSRPDNGKERVICTTQANALDEARTALIRGKQVEELQLFIRVANQDYLLTLDADLWAVKGLKTPKQLPDQGEEDADGRFLEKMFFVEEVLAVLNKLYLKFLTQRLSAGWETDYLPPVKRWIQEGATDGAG